MKLTALLRSASRAGRPLLSLLIAAAALPAAAQVSVTATGGTPGPTAYTTLKGAFDAINAGTHQAAVTVTITANTTETASAVLNASGAGSALYTSVLVKPGAAATPTVTGTVATGALIKLNGASNVTIEGSNNGSSSRNLTFTNISGSGSVVWMSSTGSAISGDSLRNCVLNGGGNSNINCRGVAISASSSIDNLGSFNNLGLRNNSISKVNAGIYAVASTASGNGNGLKIIGNDLASTGANAIGNVGIYLEGVDGATVSSNTIGNFNGSTDEDDFGIWLASDTKNSTVSQNTVSAINYTNGDYWGPAGIYVSSDVSASAITVSDNTVTNVSSNGDWQAKGIWIYGVTGGVTLNRNKISNIKNMYASGYGAEGILLESDATGAGSAIAVTNNFVWDVAAKGLNTFYATDNGYGIAIDADGPNYTIYHNTVWLNTNQTLTGGNRGAAMLITDYVSTAGCINMRNNLFINTQTVGNANSRFALVVLAANSVFSANNYNDYYSTSNNLTCRGTNGTIQTTIAGVQTNLGFNTNSVNINPTFVSATDLHLQGLAANSGLNNTGVTIAAVTTDIDGDSRAAPPDLGGDEFNICTAVTAGANPASATVCTPANASFTASATGASSYQWQVNSGSGFTNLSNGGVYSGATTATLSLTAPPASLTGYQYRLVSGALTGCPTVNSTAATLTVNQTPSVTVTASGPVALCTGGSVTLSVASVTAYNYQWKESGSNVTGANSASYVASNPGSYSVTVVNPSGNCSATSSPEVTVTVGSGPVAVISPSASTGFCAGGSASLSAGNSPGVTYQWKRDGVDVGGATGNTYSAAIAGSYRVLVTSGPACSTLSAAVNVAEYPLPAATITPSGSAAFCQGGNLVLTGNSGSGLNRQWQLGNGDLAGATGANYTATAPGSYTLRVTDANGCQKTSAPVAVTQNPLPSATISPATYTPICEGDSVLMAANTGTGFNYQWKLGAGPISGATAGNYYAKVNGSYVVTVTDGNGCQKTSMPVSLTVNPAPPSFITYNSPLSFCEGSAVVLNANTGTNLQYQWLLNGNPLAGQTGLSYMAMQSGVYTIVTRNSFNCTKTSDAVSVNVNIRPQPAILRVARVLHAGPGYAQYQWFRHNVAIPGATDSLYTISQNGMYSVYVKDDNGCDNKSAQFNIEGLGLEQTVASSGIKVYPNPAQEVVTIEQTGGARISEVVVMNGLGAVAYRAVIPGGSASTSISVGHLAGGVYTLRVLLADGSVALRKLELLSR